MVHYKFAMQLILPHQTSFNIFQLISWLHKSWYSIVREQFRYVVLDIVFFVRLLGFDIRYPISYPIIDILVPFTYIKKLKNIALIEVTLSIGSLI